MTRKIEARLHQPQVTPQMEAEQERVTELGPNSDWAELTHECLINILSRLTFEQRWRGPMLVSKSWRFASTDPSLHSVFDLESHFDQSTELRRWWSSDFESKIDFMLRCVVVWSNGCLTQIRTRHCSDHSLTFAAERCPNLEVLMIKNCPNVTDASMAKIAACCPKLRELDISYCYRISHESLLVIGSHCPNLKMLKRNLMNWIDPSQHVGIVPNEYINAFPDDGDSEAAAIAKHMSHLEHLSICFSKLSDKGLTLIFEGCPNLKYLNLTGCLNLTSLGPIHYQI